MDSGYAFLIFLGKVDFGKIKARFFLTGMQSEIARGGVAEVILFLIGDRIGRSAVFFGIGGRASRFYFHEYNIAKTARNYVDFAALDCKIARDDAVSAAAKIATDGIFTAATAATRVFSIVCFHLLRNFKKVLR